MTEEDKDIVVLCPLTKGDLPQTCEPCSFCIKQENQRVGCAIRKNIKLLLEKTQQDITNTDTIKAFHKDIKEATKIWL